MDGLLLLVDPAGKGREKDLRGKAIGRRALAEIALPSSVGTAGSFGKRLIEPDARPGSTMNAIECTQRLGSMLRFYRRAVA